MTATYGQGLTQDKHSLTDKDALINTLDALIDSYGEEVVASTKALLRIKSVAEEALEGMPFGEGPYKALDYVVSLSQQMGFESTLLDGYAAFTDYGQGEQTLGILSHVDVVPEGTGWSYDPYGGEIDNGKIYGRGALDDKGPLIASLYALKAVKEAGIVLKKKVRLLFGANEETGMESIEYYLSKEKGFDLGFTPDAVFPVIHGEKGWMNLQLSKVLDEVEQPPFSGSGLQLLEVKGGVAANVVPDQCEAILSGDKDALGQAYDGLIYYINASGNRLALQYEEGILKITSYGKASHASRPEKGENAISIMMSALSTVLKADSSDPKVSLVHLYKKLIGLDYYGQNAGCGFKDQLSGHLTFNVGVLSLSSLGLEMTIDIRYPISNTCEEVVSGVKETFGENGVEVKLTGNENPLYFPVDHELIKGLMEVYESFTGDYGRKPEVMGGLTYARSMPNIVAFGPLFPGEEGMAHQKNECVGIDQLMNMIKIYAMAIVNLAA